MPVSATFQNWLRMAETTPVVKPDALHDTFEEAVGHAVRLTNLPNDTRLQMYGLFKQATVGNCNTDEPSRWSMVEHAKWKAWKKLTGLTEMDAKQAYIDLVAKADPKFEGKTNVHALPNVRNPQAALEEDGSSSRLHAGDGEKPQISIIVDNSNAENPYVIVQEKFGENSTPIQLANLQVNDPSAPININIKPPSSSSSITTPASLIRTIRAATITPDSPVPTWAVFLLGVLFLCLLDDNISLGNIITNSLGVSVLTAMLITLQIN